jgi:ABC-type lipoprotein export system ATPase subunit
VSVLEAHGVTKSVGSGRAAHRVLSRVDIAVEAGELVAVLGRSGSGK